MNNVQKNILLVEDDQLINQLYKIKLESAGYIVDAVFDGEEAVLQLSKKKPNLVLLDINMPKQNGFYVLEKIKANTEWSEIPVLMLTNMDEFKDINKAIEMGASDYIVKSHHTVDDIIKKVKKFLSENAD